MVAAIDAHEAPGGGLYDWATSTPEQWDALAPLRDLQWPVPARIEQRLADLLDDRQAE